MKFKRKISYLFFSLCMLSFTLNAVARENSPQRLIVPPESATAHSITLLWQKPDQYANVTGYNIYSNGKYIATSDITNYTVKDLEPDHEYTFSVKAKYKDGSLSSASQKVEAKTKVVGKVFNIMDYGVKGDEVTKNTKAIQRAINACTPGGTVYIPAGKFLTGALYLE